MTDDPVTPELALVDPELRRRLLADAAPDPIESVRQANGGISRVPPVEIPTRTEPGDGQASYRRRLTVPLVVAAFSSVLTLGATAAVLELRHSSSPRTAPTTVAHPPTHTAPTRTIPATTTATTTSPTTTTPAVSTPPPARRKPPKALTFSWAAVPGATAYDIAFYAHGAHDRLVLELTTRVPSAVVKVRRAGAKTAHSLAPGPYRWYVWPVTAAGRAAVATVRSTLTVS